MYCGNCGAKLPDGAKFCGKCGAPVKYPTGSTPHEPGKGGGRKKFRRFIIGLAAVICVVGIAIVGSLYYNINRSIVGNGTADNEEQGTESTGITARVQPEDTHDSSQGTNAEQHKTAPVETHYAEIGEVYDDICAFTAEIEQQYMGSDGFVDMDDKSELLGKVAQHARDLYNKGVLTDYAYTDGDTMVYMQIDGWYDVVYDVPVRDMMANGNDIEIITLEPYAGTFNFSFLHAMANSNGPQQAAELIDEQIGDKFTYSRRYTREDVNINMLKDHEFKNTILMWFGHGGYSQKTGSVLFLGVPKDDPTAADCQAQWHDGSVIRNCNGDYYITKEFFNKHVHPETFDNSIIYLGTCSSATDQFDTHDGLIQSLLDLGARFVMGNSTECSVLYNYKMIYSFFDGMTHKHADGTYFDINEALEYARDKNGDFDVLTGCFVWGEGDIITLMDLVNPDGINENYPTPAPTAATLASLGDEKSRESHIDPSQEKQERKFFTRLNSVKHSSSDDAMVLTESKVYSRDESYSSDLDLMRVWKYEYDSQGRMVKAVGHPANYILVDPPAVSEWCDYEYDDNGNMIKEIAYDYDSGDIEDWYEYEYDSSGNIGKLTELDSDGNITDWYVMEYDVHGNKVKEDHYYPMNSEGTLSTSSDYEYNDQGNLYKKIEYTPSNNVYTQYEYKYEALANVIRQTVYDDNGALRFEYQYDMDGKLLKEIEYYSDGGIYRWFDYEYYVGWGGVSRKIIHYSDGFVLDEASKDICITGIIEYSYDNLYNVTVDNTQGDTLETLPPADEYGNIPDEALRALEQAGGDMGPLGDGEHIVLLDKSLLFDSVDGTYAVVTIMEPNTYTDEYVHSLRIGDEINGPYLPVTDIEFSESADGSGQVFSFGDPEYYMAQVNGVWYMFLYEYMCTYPAGSTLILIPPECNFYDGMDYRDESENDGPGYFGNYYPEHRVNSISDVFTASDVYDDYDTYCHVIVKLKNGVATDVYRFYEP